MLVQIEHPNQPEIVSIIGQLDAYQDSLYPPEARYALDISSLAQDNVIFAVARNENGLAIGCGAVVLGEHHGELKRMYVQPEFRSQGVATQILVKLETEAAAQGCQLIQLETGPRQPEAIAFYQRNGFSLCGRFGAYPEHPLSVFMEKALSPMSSI